MSDLLYRLICERASDGKNCDYEYHQIQYCTYSEMFYILSAVDCQLYIYIYTHFFWSCNCSSCFLILCMSMWQSRGEQGEKRTKPILFNLFFIYFVYDFNLSRASKRELLRIFFRTNNALLFEKYWSMCCIMSLLWLTKID